MDSSPPWSASSPPPLRSAEESESMFYYRGLPSSPALVGRSGITPWQVPRGPEAYPRPKVLETVGEHAIKKVWEDDLCPKLVAHLNSKEVAWTSIDVVRIGYVEELARPVIVWIGVQRKSLSFQDGTEVARSCQGILLQSGITDVDVEIRESIVTTLRGPKLLAPVSSSDPTADARNPFTSTLGLPTSGKSTPSAEGTGGFFIAEGGGSKRIFLITARHVLFKPDRNNNKNFEHKPSEPGHEVILLGDAVFRRVLESIKVEIEFRQPIIQKHMKERIASVLEVPGDEAEMERQEAEHALARAEKTMEALRAFSEDVSRRWANPDERVLGHVIYSPPIEMGVGTAQYTQDFAVIDIDLSKIDNKNFKGNVIDLGTMIPLYDFIRKMFLNLRNADTFVYPHDRLLRLQGTIPDEEMCRPLAVDQNGKACLMVLKHGSATGLTIGRSNDIRSCVRNYYEDGITGLSMEWAILAFDNKSGAFSAPGDSGAVVADAKGRMGGIITSGAGKQEEKDITYATSTNWVMQGIRAKFPDAHLNPVLNS
ncbi:hypothetical protein JAAARDRAFT_30774 [Jaapia argillacea MUCL 33604]|uniref:Peptidase S1 domain-containing protein n=1 Tax=Jaapia argillacea MUCL 33604 TaxID=933084 RepID=A0A067QCW4_9AGAM|nr:hypothetical protein JAAARDRAFT_30774 [Jaapia argillacea MUCL 33604]